MVLPKYATFIYQPRSLSTKKFVRQFSTVTTFLGLYHTKIKQLITINIKIDGKKIKCPLCVMEKTLSQAYAIFKPEFCNMKIGNTTFQTLQPINIRLKGAAKQLPCYYLYHHNIEYLQKIVARILTIRETLQTLRMMKICTIFFYVMTKIFCLSIRFVRHVLLFPS